MHSNVSPQVTLHQVLVRAMEHWAIGKEREKKKKWRAEQSEGYCKWDGCHSLRYQKNQSRYVCFKEYLTRDVRWTLKNEYTWWTHNENTTRWQNNCKTKRRKTEGTKLHPSFPSARIYTYIYIWLCTYIHVYIQRMTPPTKRKGHR